VAIPHPLLPYDQRLGEPDSPGHISSWPLLHNCQSHLAIHTVYAIIEFLCQIMRHGLTYSWQSRRVCKNIIVIWVHLRLVSQTIGDWDTARVFVAKLRFSLVLGMSWPLISSSGTTEMCNPVQNDIVGFLWGQLWQAATHYECLIPGQARINCDNTPLKQMYPSS